jgi:hypothetical protein
MGKILIDPSQKIKFELPTNLRKNVHIISD